MVLGSSKRDILIIFVLIGSFIFIRSLYFSLHLNFSQEPASHALDTYKLWQEKKITFVGPPISFQLNGRRIFQSSIGYYLMMLFLVPTNFNPIFASYVFMVFAGASTIALYWGTKMLIDKRAAIFISILYALLPFYIDFTRFFWNRNFQLSLTPYVILWMGFYKTQKHPFWLFLTATTSGVLLLFHYQYLLIILGLLIYYRLVLKIDRKSVFIFAIGVFFGFSPFILFELKNNFYNTQTAILFLQNYAQVFGDKGGVFRRHYLLSSSLFIWLVILSWGKKLLKKGWLIFLFALLFLIDLAIYAKAPSHAFGMTKSWNVLYEKKSPRL